VRSEWSQTPGPWEPEAKLPKRACLKCGVLTERSYCYRCDPDRERRRGTPGRTTKAQAQFRKAVLAASGFRCEAIENGQRCTATTRLEAHHLDALRDSRSYDPRRGVCLCARHHHLVERDAA
jgi:hypothetical protein